MARNADGSVVVDDQGYPKDSVDPLEWTDAFALVDDNSADQLAAWFAAAIITGQQSPDADIPLEF